MPSDWVKDSAQSALLNASPYECSRGSTPSKYRDSVFRAAWAAGGSALVQGQLLHSYRPGDLVVNACTKGRLGKPSHEDVESLDVYKIPGPPPAPNSRERTVGDATCRSAQAP